MSGTDSEDEYYYREVRRKDGKSKSIEVSDCKHQIIMIKLSLGGSIGSDSFTAYQ